MRYLKWNWNLGAGLILLLVLTPILVIVSHIPFLEHTLLQDIRDGFFKDYIYGSLMLLVGVLFLSFIFGASTAYLVAFHTFFGAKVFEWLLILPFAIPAYIMGLVWTDLMQFEGIIPTLLGVNRRIDIMNIYGAIILLSFSLYPYVFFFLKNSFSKSLGNVLLSAQSLSSSSVKIFWKVILPFCRLSIIGSLSLVGMETLSEFGLVSFFGVDSFSAGIYKEWNSSGGDETGAIALSGILILFVFAILLIEFYQRGKRGYQRRQFMQAPKKKLKGVWAGLAFLWCALLTFFAFIVPIVWLLYWGVQDFSENLLKFSDAIYYSLLMSLGSAFLIVVIAYYLCFVVRLGNNKFASIILKTCSLGYAVPGTVIAIGLLLFFSFINTSILEKLSISYALGGGFAILFFGYLIRFLSSGIFSMESSYANISKNIDYSSILLRPSPFALFFKIHLPLLKNGLALVFVIVSIDILKELPISTILSPSGYQTLFAAVFAYAENELIYNMALPSLLIVLFALIPTLMMQVLEKNRK